VFRIERFERISQGSYRVVLVTDDPGFLPALRLLRHVSAAADLLHERIDRERRVLRLLESQAAAEPAARADRAKLLAMYHELPGPRSERMKALRRILADQYGRCGYDDAMAIVSLAIHEHRAAQGARAVELAAGGSSCREIGVQLGISPAQASRISHPENGEAVKCPRIDDLPSPAYRGAVFPVAFSRGEKSQEENGIPEGGATALFGGAAVRGK
jgi:hypothetical protein